MTRHDPEIEELREKVHCAVVLEQTPPFWKLDRKESTKLSLKYRRAKKGSIRVLASDMSASACGRSPDNRHVFHRPTGQGAARSRTDPSPLTGPDERRFGRTLRRGGTLDESAGCQRRLLRRRPWPAFCARVPSAAPGSPTLIAPALLRMWTSVVRSIRVR
jgi:hypothetical protein